MTLEGRILSPRGFVRGRLHFSERILAVEEAPVEGPYILPGFLDLHVHGGLGADAMEGKEAVLRMARFHLQHGTTGLLATTVTAPPEDLRRALSGIAEAMAECEALLGAHLEGPSASAPSPHFPRSPTPP